MSFYVLILLLNLRAVFCLDVLKLFLPWRNLWYILELWVKIWTCLMISNSLRWLQRSNLSHLLTIIARKDLFPAFFNSLNCSVSPPFPWPLLNPGFLTTSPPPLFWTVALPISVFEVAPMMIFNAPFPSTYLRGQHCFPTLKQALCVSFILQSLSGLQWCLSVGCIDLISTNSPSWLHTWRLRKSSIDRARDVQVRLWVQARVLTVRRGVLKSCLNMSREVRWHHILGLGMSPLLRTFDGLSVTLVTVRTPVRDPLFLYSDSWEEEWKMNGGFPIYSFLPTPLCSAWLDSVLRWLAQRFAKASAPSLWTTALFTLFSGIITVTRL